MSTQLAVKAEADKSSPPILVVGLGNRNLGDEGVGPRIIDELLQYRWASQVHLMDLGCDLLSLISYPHKPQKLIILDAIRAGGTVGTIYLFDYDQLETTGAEMSSAHQIPALSALGLLREICPNLTDCEIIIIGIEPKIMALGADLSERIAASVADVVKLVRDELSGHFSLKTPNNFRPRPMKNHRRIFYFTN